MYLSIYLSICVYIYIYLCIDIFEKKNARWLIKDEDQKWQHPRPPRVGPRRVHRKNCPKNPMIDEQIAGFLSILWIDYNDLTVTSLGNK